jgi:hypothetical protein
LADAAAFAQEEESFMRQEYELNMLRSLVYTPRKGFEAPFVAGLSKDRTKLIIRVATQESLLPDDFKAREDELFVVAKRCELYFGTSAEFTNSARVEFMRNDADTTPVDQNISDEEFLKRMTLAVYENGELQYGNEARKQREEDGLFV